MLTGGYPPRKTVIDAIRHADLFATIVPEDTYAVASEIHDLLVKTHIADGEKIEEIKALVWEHLFIDRVSRSPPRSSSPHSRQRPVAAFGGSRAG